MEILRYPDPRLKAPNAPLERFGPEEQAKVEEMYRLMANVDGVGLAAPQVGWNVRLFILSFAGPEDAEAKVFVFWNPTLELHGEKILMSEGCLSFPGIPGDVERWTHARLVAETPGGKIDVAVSGFPAQAVQHEMDHIDGVLFIDRMSPVERARMEPLLEELRKKH